MADNADTDILDLSGNGKGVALDVYPEDIAMSSGGTGMPFVTPEQFGAVGDDVTNDGPAFLAMMNYLEAGRTGYIGSFGVQLGMKSYFLGNTTLNNRTTKIFQGTGRYGTRLRWAPNTVGIINQRVNTANGLTGIAAGPVGGGDNSIFRHMMLQGAYAGVEGEYHGLALRSAARLEDLFLVGWQGDGIYAEAEAGGGATEGNTNGSYVVDCAAQGCRNGLLMSGNDANVWNVLGFDSRSCRQFGIWDTSALGNNFIGCRSAGNGWDGALGSIPTACYVNPTGYRYACIPGQELWCSNNPPTGTTAHNQGWLFVGGGGAYNGIALWTFGTIFRAGGAGYFDGGGGNQISTVENYYAEPDQNPVFVGGGQILFTGGYVTPYAGNLLYPGVIRGNGNRLYSQGDFEVGKDLNVISQMSVGGSIIAQGAITARGDLWSGPVSGVGDGIARHNFGSGFLFDSVFNYWSGGINYEVHHDTVYSGGERNIKANSALGVGFFTGSPYTQTLRITSTGIELDNGKVVKINGNQILTGRQVKPGVPTLTDVVNLLVTHGLWA